jgi:hypothetical protein
MEDRAFKDDPAYREGRTAFEDNYELADNPYPSLSADWHDWQRGWCDASEDDWETRRGPGSGD